MKIRGPKREIVSCYPTLKAKRILFKYAKENGYASLSAFLNEIIEDKAKEVAGECEAPGQEKLFGES